MAWFELDFTFDLYFIHATFVLQIICTWFIFDLTIIVGGDHEGLFIYVYMGNLRKYLRANSIFQWNNFYYTFETTNALFHTKATSQERRELTLPQWRIIIFVSLYPVRVFYCFLIMFKSEFFTIYGGLSTAECSHLSLDCIELPSPLLSPLRDPWLLKLKIKYGRIISWRSFPIWPFFQDPRAQQSEQTIVALECLPLCTNKYCGHSIHSHYPSFLVLSSDTLNGKSCSIRKKGMISRSFGSLNSSRRTFSGQTLKSTIESPHSGRLNPQDLIPNLHTLFDLYILNTEKVQQWNRL